MRAATNLICVVAFAGVLSGGAEFDVASIRRLPAGAPRTGLAQRIDPTSLTLRSATRGTHLRY
jgi:hypothetical protein